MARFTDSELEVMGILWDAGEQKPQEILKRHPRPVSNSTLRTFLADLVEKGHVARTKRGKVFYYRALTKPDSALKTRLTQIIDLFCGGSHAALAKHLVESEKLSSQEIRDLRALLDEAGERRGRKGKGE